MLRVAPWFMFGLLVLPVVAGLATIVLPAFGYLPALQHTEPGLAVWVDLLDTPGIGRSAMLSFAAGLLTPLLSLALVMLFLASASGTRWAHAMRRLVAPLLAVPHAAAAFGLAFLMAPSGFALRLISPELSGWQRPPDLLILNDPLGLSMMLGMVLKEIPFLLLMALAALPQLNPDQRVAMARTLGYRPILAWFWTVAPALYPMLRLPLFAVIAFASATVDVALILGPTLPPPLSVRIIGWFSDPDLNQRLLASAAALMQLAITLSAIGLWIAAEKVVARLYRRVLLSGVRNTGHTLLNIAGKGLMVLTLGALLLSLVLLIVHAFAGPWRFPANLPGTWTTQHWLSVGPVLLTPLRNTMLLALGSTLLAVVLVIAALEHESRQARAPARLLWAIYLPLLVPQVVFLYGLTLLLEQLRWLPGLVMVCFAHCLFVVPYVYLSLAEPYRRLDPRWQQLSATLGVSANRSLWRIKLPMLMAPIATAGAVGLAVSIGQYLATLLTGAGRVSTLTTEAVALASGGTRGTIAVWALLQAAIPMLGFALAIAWPRFWWRHRRDMRGQLT
ncbi:MAG: ABC transporter permease [Gammaproteobacteria bacterium]|nr:ABC transporter permease [Gammaproteobacteria bacterium]|tara:strand:+ start:1195 stop:2877 length:1683 start_codon:yes stop_codon:yes gene_type:complete